MERIDKLLCSTGRWSRREIKDLIRQGRVLANGVLMRKGEEKVDPASVILSVDGQRMEDRKSVV